MSDTESVTQTADAVVIPDADQPNEDGSPVVAPHAPLDPAPTTDGSDPGEPAAQVASATNTDPVAPAEPAGPRAAPSDLEGDLRKVLDDYVSGKLTLAEGALPTPHTLASEIAKLRDDGKRVSSGAVSAALVRWQEIGFATLGEKPMVFIDYTDAARSEGLSALKATHRAGKNAARKATKEPGAQPAAETQPAPKPAAETPVNPTVDAAPAEPVQTETVAENVEVVQQPDVPMGVDDQDARPYPQQQQHDPAPTSAPGTPF